jgi:Trypsin
MRKALAALVAVAALGVTAAALAITDGTPDGNGHPYVGLMVAHNASGTPIWRCSGTLMSSGVFMVAGHCTEAPAAHAEIFFASEITTNPAYAAASAAAGHNVPCKGFSGYPCKGDTGGTPYTHPQYDPNAFYLYDLGVVKLSKAYSSSTYGKLPQLNALDALHRGAPFTAVGYGLQKAFPDATAWKEQAAKTRMVAYPELVQINTGFTGDGSLVLSNNANTGGTCFGDSGGPNFVGDSNVVGGVTSFGLNGTCAGTGGVYRVDRADDLNWLATFGLH